MRPARTSSSELRDADDEGSTSDTPESAGDGGREPKVKRYIFLVILYYLMIIQFP